METYERISDLRAALTRARREGKRIGLVPTMGALHDGHLSLVEIAKRYADTVVMTVFVNPTQFNSARDLARYPRELESDAEKARGAGVDLLFAPAESEIYQTQTLARTSVLAGEAAEGLCGATRPGHFNGVVTVVSILFNIVNPDVAVFGEKDYQQLKVIQQLVRDLHFGIEIVGAPLIRESDGLAMSSRNKLLTSADRSSALAISRSLFAAQDEVRAGERSSEAIKGRVQTVLEQHGLRVDYVEVVDVDTLQPCDVIMEEARLLAAVFAGEVRLIDNVALTKEP